MKLLSCVRLFATPWIVAYQAPPSMGFSRQECWSRLPFPFPGDLPDPGIEPGSPALQAYALPPELCGKRLRIQKGLHIKAKLGGEGGMDQELERWHPTPVRLPGKSRGWRSLVGYSPWGYKESDTTKRLHLPYLKLIL